ncbi:MAG: hypothetical protein M1438_14805 [Deltaproteobacteria bacterium]|nr:hypothetical protein [Deltaproteobacteria bacterium]
MRNTNWLWMALLLGLAAGCCSRPEIFQKAHSSMQTVQNFYEPLVQQDLCRNESAKRAVVAADTTLLLAGELQKQWCPDQGQARQLELQASEAQKLAQEAGVADAAPKEQGN